MGDWCPEERLYLHQFVLSGAEAYFLCVLQAALPVGIGVDEFKEFIGTIGVIVATSAIALAAGVLVSCCWFPSIDYRCFVYEVGTGLVEGYRVECKPYCQARQSVLLLQCTAPQNQFSQFRLPLPDCAIISTGLHQVYNANCCNIL